MLYLLWSQKILLSGQIVTSYEESMDIMESEISPPLVLMYAMVSFICVMLVIILIYVTNTKKYRLNWFEQTLLENATEVDVSKDGVNCDETERFWVPSQKFKSTIDDCSLNDVECGEGVADSPTGSMPSMDANLNNIPIVANDKQVILAPETCVRPKLPSMQANLDHTKINASLYTLESPTEIEGVRGSIHLKLSYDTVAGILTIRLIEATELHASDFSGTANPYAKIRLLPDKTNVWQTRIHKKTLNPIFDEDFVFEIEPVRILSTVIEVLLYDFDAYSRHHVIGATQASLAEISLVSGRAEIWRPLAAVAQSDARVDLGEIMVSVAYLPSAGRLTVVIVKARNLRVVDDTRNSSDPFIKICLMHEAKRLKKKKTNIQRNTVNPVFNEALTFDVNKTIFKNCVLELFVFHDNLLGTSELLGSCKIGNSVNCNASEKDFFIQINRNKTATAKWLTLSDACNYTNKT